jgi:hypothetical protein
MMNISQKSIHPPHNEGRSTSMNKCKRNAKEDLLCLSLIVYCLFILTANAHCEEWRILSKNYHGGSLADKSLQFKDATVKPWSDSILWDSLLKTKSHASFSAKINDKLPEFNFKIIGKLNGKYFHPSHVEITNASNGKLIQKLMAKNRFDNDGDGWVAVGDIREVDLVQVFDVNFDGYPDLRLLNHSGGASGQSVHATYLYNPSVGKFKYQHEFSKLSGMKIDKDLKLITSDSTSGACFYSKGYYSITGNKLTLSKIEWTEIDRRRDKEAREFGCFKYSGIPRSEDVMIVPDDFILAMYENKLPYLRKKLKNVKEEQTILN